jgi:hypothetical protein
MMPSLIIIPVFAARGAKRCTSDPAKQTNFWDMAMARANELANFNNDSGGEVGLEQDRRQEGRLQGEAGRGQRLHDSKSGIIQHTGCPRAAAQDAASSIQDQVAGMPAAAQAALLQTLTAALSKSVAEDKGGKR